MKIYRELTVRCTPEDLNKFFAALQNLLAAGWQRSEDAEGLLRNDVYYRFRSNSRPGLVNAEIWVTYNFKKQCLWVANIFPKSVPRLGVSEYNRLVSDFYKSSVKLAADELGFQSSLTDEDVEASHWGVSKRTIELLEAFSSEANKSTASSHPMDRQRWYKFLISIHRDHAELDVTSLGQMLVENYGWLESTASDLRQEYEFAMGLLAQYDWSGR